MQLNDGRFMQNGRCGYILQPECMRHLEFDPFNKKTFVGVEPITVTLTVSQRQSNYSLNSIFRKALLFSPVFMLVKLFGNKLVFHQHLSICMQN